MHVEPKDIVLIIMDSKKLTFFIVFAFIYVYVVEKRGTACVWKLEGNLW